MGNFTLQAYHAAIQGIEEKVALGQQISQMEQQEALAKLSATGAALGDQNIQSMIVSYGLPGTLKYVTDQANMWTQFQTNTEKAIDFKMMTDAARDLKNDPEFQKATPQERYKMWQDLQNKYSAGTLGELSDDAATLAAQRLLSGDTTALYNVGRGIQGSRNLTKILNLYAEMAKEQGMSGSDIANRIAEFQGLKAGERTAGTRAAQVSLAANEAVKMADLALQASAAVPRGQFVPLNQAQLAVEKGTSDPAVARFVAANNSFVNV